MLVTQLNRTSTLVRRPRPRLVCLDLQREYVVPGRPLYADGAGLVADHCTRVLTFARRQGWRVIHAQRRHAEGLFDRTSYFGAPIEGLRPLISEPVFAHTGLSAFGNPDFTAELRDAVGQDVFLIGFSLSSTCLATALAAVDLGLTITVVDEAVGAAPAPGLAAGDARAAAITLLSPIVGLVSADELFEQSAALEVTQ
jgi:nicotinamidase-related amidase